MGREEGGKRERSGKQISGEQISDLGGCLESSTRRRGVVNKSDSDIESYIPLCAVLVSIVPPAISKPSCLLPLRPPSPLYPALSHSSDGIFQAPSSLK